MARTAGEIAEEIIAYLQSHPDAQDTLEGISEWWLLEQRVERGSAEVREAIRRLLSAGRLVEARGSDSRVRYHLAPGMKGSEPIEGGNRMAVILTNKSPRLVTVELNSGDWLHLAPGESSKAIDELEVRQNRRLEKLVRGNLVATDTPAEGVKKPVKAARPHRP